MNAHDLPAGSKTWPAIAAALFNLVPVIGVLFWGWSAFALIFLYWIENLVVGVRTIASMLSTAVSGPAHLAGALAISAFFTVHYGMFCFVHGVFVVSMFGDQTVAGDGIFDLWAVSSHLFATEPGLFTGLLSIVLWQVVQFGLFIVRGEATRLNPLELMASPYPRIIVLHMDHHLRRVLAHAPQPAAGRPGAAGAAQSGVRYRRGAGPGLQVQLFAARDYPVRGLDLGHTI